MAKAITLVDNFNDDVQDTSKWVASVSDQLREVNGRVEIRPEGNQTGGYFLNYQSATTYDLTGSEFRVELVRAPVGVYGAAAYLQARIDDDNRIQLQVTGETLNADSIVSGTLTKLALIPYDPVAHRWLRLREQLGTVYFEVSANGVEWTAVATQSPAAITLTAVYALFGAGTFIGSSIPWPGTTVFDNFNVQNTQLSRRVEERRLSARDVRVEAAQLSAARRHDEHHNNNDEANYDGRPFIGNFSKGLKHDDYGDPEPVSYGTLLRALESRDPQDFEELQLFNVSPRQKFTNPQTGLTFDLEGPDPQEITQPPAPRFDSAVTAHEAGELYWMALARDVPFISYGSDAVIADAVTSLNTEFSQFGGTAPVSAPNVFRGIFPGEQVGPYVSQFLVKGNVDPRKPAGEGRDAEDGFISYGSRTVDQRLYAAVAATDYLTDYFTWLDVQNGQDWRGQDVFDTTRKFIYTLRAGTTFVHFDNVIDAWYNAALILMSEPVGDQLTAAGATGRPQIDFEFAKDQGNPYDPPGTAMDSRTQAGFSTFGVPHVLQLLSETLGRALRAVWFQKWFVHRRLRPEEYGGRVHNHVTEARTYPLDDSIVDSLTTGGLSEYITDTYLLPQAFPEGCPAHPSYGAGHATGSGALCTILKAFFDESTLIENPLQPNVDGTELVPYTGEDASLMTVGYELNKLAGNIALFRNAAGVHWRSDYTESLLLGEAVAIGILQEQSLGFNEDDAYFQLTRFDGTTIRIFDGQVVKV